MGQVFSKNKKEQTPYEILNVNELSNSKEIKKAYRSLYYQNQRNPEIMEKLNHAMSAIENNFELDLYLELYKRIDSLKNGNRMESNLRTKSYSKNNHIKTYSSINNEKSKPEENKKSNNNFLRIDRESDKTMIFYKNTSFEFKFLEISSDVFSKMTKAYKIKLPFDFTGNEFHKFYSAWNRVYFDDKDFENRIKQLVRLIKNNDPRIKMENNEIKKVVVNEKVINKSEEKEKKQFKVFCKGCNKGFNNRNTLKDHLNSKKHKMECSSNDCLVYNVPLEVFENENR